MSDQLTRKDIQEVQKQIDELSKRMLKLKEELQKEIYEAAAAGERFTMKVAEQTEQKVAPLRDKIAAIEKRLAALED